MKYLAATKLAFCGTHMGTRQSSRSTTPQISRPAFLATPTQLFAMENEKTEVLGRVRTLMSDIEHELDAITLETGVTPKPDLPQYVAEIPKAEILLAEVPHETKAAEHAEPEVVAEAPKEDHSETVEKVVAEAPKEEHSETVEKVVAEAPKEEHSETVEKMVAEAPKEEHTDAVEKVVAEAPKEEHTETVEKVVAEAPKEDHTETVEKVVAEAPKEAHTESVEKIVAEAPQEIKIEEVVSETPKEEAAVEKIVASIPKEAKAETLLADAAPIKADVAEHADSMAPAFKEASIQVADAFDANILAQKVSAASHVAESAASLMQNVMDHASPLM